MLVRQTFFETILFEEKSIIIFEWRCSEFFDTVNLFQIWHNDSSISLYKVDHPTEYFAQICGKGAWTGLRWMLCEREGERFIMCLIWA